MPQEPTIPQEEELIIKPVLNGFIVVAGSVTLVYETTDHIIDDFTQWARDSERIQAHKLMRNKGSLPDPEPPQ